MPNEATATDQFVRHLIENIDVAYYEQGSDNFQISTGLKHASKRGTNKPGNPDFSFLVDNYPVLVEDKPSVYKANAYDSQGRLLLTQPETVEYADNGAVWYATHVVKNSFFHEAFAVGVAGNSTYAQIQPYYVSNNDGEITIKKLNRLIDFDDFKPSKIHEYYRVEVLGEPTKEQLQIQDLQKAASSLHEDLRNYGSLEGENKATVVSALLLALSGNPELLLATMTGSQEMDDRDGDKIYNEIQRYLHSSRIQPKNPNAKWTQKVTVVLNKFTFVKTNQVLNSINPTLGITPLKYFAQKLESSVLDHFKSNTDYDILGSFYGEFVKYGGSDGNSLGIVLTPHHITALMTELIDIQPEDYVLDPACGSASFLISAMNRMVQDAKDDKQKTDIKQNHLYGVELQEKLFTVATTNMILRGDGKSNLQLDDMFRITPQEMHEKHINKILFNPPYSQAKNKETRKLSELSFIRHALDLSVKGGRLAVIVPQSAMIGKTKYDKQLKAEILEHHTLDAVITCNSNTFYGIGVNPVIALFTAGVPHDPDKMVSFVDYRDDGFVVKKHVGLVDDGSNAVKRRDLVAYLTGKLTNMSSKTALKTTITADDEWLHSFYYFNDEIPSSEDFSKTVQDYLAFKFEQTVHGRAYLFENEDQSPKK